MVHSSSHNVAQPFLLTWTECHWRERVAQHTLTRAAAAALAQQFGNSCRSVASVPPAGSAVVPPHPSKGSSAESSSFHQLSSSSDRFSQWTSLHFSKISMYQSSFSHGCISTSWKICLSKFWKAQAATCELCCQNCQPASLPTSADPVRLFTRQCYVFLTHWKSKAGAHWKFPRDWTHRHSWWFLHIYVFNILIYMSLSLLSFRKIILY